MLQKLHRLKGALRDEIEAADGDAAADLEETRAVDYEIQEMLQQLDIENIIHDKVNEMTQRGQ